MTRTYVNAEIDLGELSDADLKEEMDARKLEVAKDFREPLKDQRHEFEELLTRIHEELTRFNDIDEALFLIECEIPDVKRWPTKAAA